MMLGEIVLNVRGAKERMRSMVKTDVPLAARMIHDLVVKAKGARLQPALPSLATQPPAIYLLGQDGVQNGPCEMAQVQQRLAAGEVQADIYSDWRMIVPLVKATLGERVEVVEGDGSLWGAHGLRLVTDDDPQVHP